MTHDEKIVEAVARAIADHFHKDADFGMDGASAYAARPREFQATARAAITAFQAEASKKRISGAHKIAMAVRDIQEGNLAAVHFNGQTWRPEPQWQDISTAPKDADSVFLWGYLESSPEARPHIGSEDRFEAYWDSDSGGWRSAHYEGWIVSPTFWHSTPLPPAPKATP